MHFADVVVDVAVVEVGCSGVGTPPTSPTPPLPCSPTWSRPHRRRGDCAGDCRGEVGIAASSFHVRVRRGVGDDLRDLLAATEAERRGGGATSTGDHVLASGGWSIEPHPLGTTDDVLLPLHGEHQADNAAVARRGGGVLRSAPRRRRRAPGLRPAYRAGPLRDRAPRADGGARRRPQPRRRRASAATCATSSRCSAP
ncbi:MAG: hypothetical protein R2711_08980 [Acidimicrobiales bacterium]